MAGMLPREAYLKRSRVVVGMNRSDRRKSVKCFERSNRLDTALYKNIPLLYFDEDGYSGFPRRSSQCIL